MQMNKGDARAQLGPQPRSLTTQQMMRPSTRQPPVRFFARQLSAHRPRNDVGVFEVTNHATNTGDTTQPQQKAACRSLETFAPI